MFNYSVIPYGLFMAGICNILLSFLILFALISLRKIYRNKVNKLIFYLLNLLLIIFGAYSFGRGLYNLSINSIPYINIFGIIVYLIPLILTIIKNDLKRYIKLYSKSNK